MDCATASKSDRTLASATLPSKFLDALQSASGIRLSQLDAGQHFIHALGNGAHVHWIYQPSCIANDPGGAQVLAVRIGHPQAIASSRGMPKPSCNDGNENRSASV